MSPQIPSASLKYCAFLDVLGYKELVINPIISKDIRVQKLFNIYENLLSTFLTNFSDLKADVKDKIQTRSFSDCFYFESELLNCLLHIFRRTYDNIFHYYDTYPSDEKYTPIIRGGVVRDWTVWIKDISSVISGSENTNPIGLGVMRAYLTSEKSYLSGMRLIISPEVFSDLTTDTVSNLPFECYKVESESPFNGSSTIPLYLTPIRKNENDEVVNLYELLWPDLSSCTFEQIKTLEKIKQNFPKQHMRHFKKTAEVIYKALLLTTCAHTVESQFENCKKKLEEYINEN